MDEYVLKAEAIGKAVKSLMDECADMTTDALAHVFRLGQTSKSPIIWLSNSGRNVRILCTDKPGAYPIVGYFIDSMCCTVLYWTAEGMLAGSGTPGSNLIIPDGFTVGAPDKTEAGDLK